MKLKNLAICVATVVQIYSMSAYASSTNYLNGTSPLLSASPSGTFDFGNHLPNFVGGSNGTATNGTALDGNRVYIYDTDYLNGVAGITPNDLHLLVWKFNTEKDSVRLYTHQDHYTGGDVYGNAPEVLEYSIWGCNTNCAGTTATGWGLLSDPISYTNSAAPTYTFNGTAATTIYRGGSAEYGITNAYVQDYNFSSAYMYFAIRGSTIAMKANTADPELDAMVAFNKNDLNPVPIPAAIWLFGSALAGLVGVSRRKTGNEVLSA